MRFLYWTVKTFVVFGTQSNHNNQPFGAAFLNLSLSWHPWRHEITNDISISIKVRRFLVFHFALSGPFNEMNQLVSSSRYRISKIIQNKEVRIADILLALIAQVLDELEYGFLANHSSSKKHVTRPKSFEEEIRQFLPVKVSRTVQHTVDVEADERTIWSIMAVGLC